MDRQLVADAVAAAKDTLRRADEILKDDGSPWCHNGVAMARLILAEHPEDEFEECTEERLKAAGLPTKIELGDVDGNLDGDVIRFFDGQGWETLESCWGEYVRLPVGPTMGHARRFLASLILPPSGPESAAPRSGTDGTAPSPPG